MSKPKEKDCQHCLQYISCDKTDCDYRLIFNGKKRMVSKEIADEIDLKLKKELYNEERNTKINYW